MIKEVIKTDFEGLYVVVNEVFHDERGCFIQQYQKEDYFKNGIKCEFIQDNLSLSNGKDTIRGMHYQLRNIQDKLISVVRGKIFDVVVDMRKQSNTFGKWFGIELSELNGYSLMIPQGFAHGFRTLSKYENIISYKASDIYNKNSEFSVNWADPTINIDWTNEKKYCKINVDKLKISDKDDNAPRFDEIPVENLPILI